MKVSELIKLLQNCNPDYDIFYEDADIGRVQQVTDIAYPEENRVELWES